MVSWQFMWLMLYLPKSLRYLCSQPFFSLVPLIPPKKIEFVIMPSLTLIFIVFHMWEFLFSPDIGGLLNLPV